MLTGVYLRNFQSIQAPVFLKLDKLCFLYGPNSAGKSSILDALELIKKTVTGDTGAYPLYQLYEKNRNKRGGVDCSVGLEFVLSKTSIFTSDEISGAKEWWSSPDQRGDYFHQDFFSKIKGKKIQIEFGRDGFSIKVAIEGEPLFEFDNESVEYDDFYKRILPSDDDGLLTDQYLTGRLTIHKKNVLNEIYDYDYRDFLSNKKKNRAYLPIQKYFSELFVDENEEKLCIYGLSFDADREFQTGIVDLSYDVESIIFPDYDRLKLYRPDDKNYQKFIAENYDESLPGVKAYAEGRKRIYWNLENIARDFEKLIKGFFYQAQYAIKYEQVKGDRQLLNSESCFSYPRRVNLDLKNCSLAEDNPMSTYARYLADPESWVYPYPVIKNDFINNALKEYLISLRGYEIYPEVFDLHQKGKKDALGKFIFLKIRQKNKVELGFQDVGSGISYIFPILTSLWASKISFIEQPELHLHPSAQCELGDVFIAAHNKGSNAVVESHSEHMLLRILRRIRETTNNYLMPKELKFSANDLRIYYFKPEPDGNTTVKEIRVDDQGELLNAWPGGFFSERDRELFGE